MTDNVRTFILYLALVATILIAGEVKAGNIELLCEGVVTHYSGTMLNPTITNKQEKEIFIFTVYGSFARSDYQGEGKELTAMHYPDINIYEDRYIAHRTFRNYEGNLVINRYTGTYYEITKNTLSGLRNIYGVGTCRKAERIL